MIYATIGIILAVITLIAFLAVSIVGFYLDIKDGQEDWEDLTFCIFLSILAAVMAGLLWPLTILLSVVFGIAGWLKYRQNLRDREA